MFSKFDTNIQSDELTAADLYEAQAEWEAEQAELAEIADAQWEAYIADHELDEHEMRHVNAELEALEEEHYVHEPFAFMMYDDPDYWD
jgi:hypothetical protein